MNNTLVTNEVLVLSAALRCIEEMRQRKLKRVSVKAVECEAKRHNVTPEEIRRALKTGPTELEAQFVAALLGRQPDRVNVHDMMALAELDDAAYFGPGHGVGLHAARIVCEWRHGNQAWRWGHKPKRENAA